MSAFVRMLTLLLLGVSTAPAWADDAPKGFDDGTAAIRAKDWTAAEAAFREVLAQQPTYWLARHGLAQALLGQSRTPEAVKAWRKAVLDADRLGVDAEARTRYRKAREALAKHDKVSSKLDRLLSSAAKDVTKFANSKRRKEPALAETMLRLAVKVDPTYQKGHDALAKMDALPSGEWVRLYHGTMKEWGDLNSKEWKPQDQDTLEVDGLNIGYQTRTDRVFIGDFDFRVEIKLIKRGDRAWSLTLDAGTSMDSLSFGIGQDQLLFISQRWDGDRGDPLFNAAFKDMTPPIDPETFNRFELRFRGEQVEALVNGQQVAKTRRAFVRYRSAMGVSFNKVQGQFRKMEIRQR